MSKPGRPALPNLSSSTKECKRCRAVKDIGEFHRDKSSRDGRVPYCKLCRSKIRAARRRRGPLRGALVWGYFPRLGASPKEADNTRKIIEQEFEMFRAAGWPEEYIRNMYPRKFLGRVGVRL